MESRVTEEQRRKLAQAIRERRVMTPDERRTYDILSQEWAESPAGQLWHWKSFWKSLRFVMDLTVGILVVMTLLWWVFS